MMFVLVFLVEPFLKCLFFPSCSHLFFLFSSDRPCLCCTLTTFFTAPGVFPGRHVSVSAHKCVCLSVGVCLSAGRLDLLLLLFSAAVMWGLF